MRKGIKKRFAHIWQTAAGRNINMQIRHILKDEEIRRLKNADPDSLQAKLYWAYRARILDATRFPEIRQPGDEKEWFHLCQPRCEGAAFLWQVERNEHLGQWVHDAAMWIAGIWLAAAAVFAAASIFAVRSSNKKTGA